MKFWIKPEPEKFEEYFTINVKKLNGYNWQVVTNKTWGHVYEMHHADTLNNFNFSYHDLNGDSTIFFCSLEGEYLTINAITTFKAGKEKNYKSDKYMKKYRTLAPTIYNAAVIVNALNIPAYDD